MLRKWAFAGGGAVLIAAVGWTGRPEAIGRENVPAQPAPAKIAEKVAGTDAKPAEAESGAEGKVAGVPAKVAEAAPVADRPGTDGVGRIRLSPKHDVWLDPKRKELTIEGEVCTRGAPLEMLVTLDGTLKMYESVVACKVKAFVVHAGLLALGAKPGTPAVFSPEYRPATGTEIEVRFRWTDGAGKAHDIDGRDWVRHARTKQAMRSPFVFVGSGFMVDSETGERTYLAEEGDFVCVSNFPTAMIDVATRSTNSDADLMFECFVERIPPVRTPVTVVLKPKFPRAN